MSVSPIILFVVCLYFAAVGLCIGFILGGMWWKSLHQETVRRWDVEAKQRIKLEEKLLSARVEIFALQKRACAMSRN